VTRPSLSATIRRLDRASGALATQSVSRMDEALPWFRSMPADQRSWIMLIAQAGIAAMVEWIRDPQPHPQVTGEVFGAAPRELARSVTLQQAVAMVKVTVNVIEEQVDHLAAPGEEGALREAVLRYSREVAFAAAEVYARIAETRGAWDARLQALLVDALLRGDPPDALASRVAALGWTDLAPVAVVIGAAPAGDTDQILDEVDRAGRHAGIDVLAGVQGNRLVVVIGGSSDPVKATLPLLAEFGDGPVVVGHAVPTLAAATVSARAAEAGARAVVAWPGAPRPVAAADLLPERLLDGDPEAREHLLQHVYAPLAAAGGSLLDTLTVYLETGCTLEGTARLLFVHPNTVRYRLRRVTDVCALSPSSPRDALTLRLSVALGRLEGDRL